MNKEEVYNQLLNNADNFIAAIIEKTDGDELDLSNLGIIQIDLNKHNIQRFVKLDFHKNLLTKFTSIPNYIISLNISFNRFENINFIKELVNLQELNFSYNENVNLDNNIFSNLIELQTIDMAGNNLYNISNISFTNLNKLIKLNISGNNVFNIINIILPNNINFINATYNNISSEDQEIMKQRLNKIIF